MRIEGFKISVWVTIVILAVSILLTWYPKPLNERITPRMTEQQIEWLRNHPEYPYRTVGFILIALAGGVLAIAYVLFRLGR